MSREAQWGSGLLPQPMPQADANVSAARPAQRSDFAQCAKGLPEALGSNPPYIKGSLTGSVVAGGWLRVLEKQPPLCCAAWGSRPHPKGSKIYTNPEAP